ncbi:MAG: regulatory protein MarR [Mucilaginibacter sp.]|nr:regulatory protein MarR [Mucilaginibacter sp.]
MRENNIQDIRAFNRFYTDLIGLLNQHLLDSSYSLAEARIIYEVYKGKSIKASQIMETMQIDKSYLSRLIKKLEKDGIIIKKQSEQDARAIQISLSQKGLKEFDRLNKASDNQITELLKPLTNEESEQLSFHMKAIVHLLKANDR